jgi:hypothetical protein
MDDTLKPREENLRHALSENWAHARHIENQRSSFAKMFLTVSTAVFAFFADKDFGGHWPVLLCLILFGLLGLLATLKFSSEFDIHMKANGRIIESLGLETYMGYPTAFKEKPSIFKVVRVRYVYIVMYLVIILICVLLLL